LLVVLDPIGGRGVAVAVGLGGLVTPLPGALVGEIPAAASAALGVSAPPPAPLALEAQLELVMVLVSRFTAPVLASSLP